MGYRFVGIILVICTSASAATFGRFVGVLKHDTSKKEQLAKLDFIVSRSNANQLELKAVLTLHFGDFKTGEYVSYHYDEVLYNPVTSSLTFDDAEQPLSIFVERFSNDEIIGKVTSIWGGSVGEIKLKKDGVAAPTLPLIGAVTGEYYGDCDGEPTWLNLHTFRSTEDNAHQAQPFAPYFIRGELMNNCVDGKCYSRRFTEGSYNFFDASDQISLSGTRSSLVCTAEETGVSCKVAAGSSRCFLTRVSNEASGPRRLSPVSHKGSFPEEDPSSPTTAKSINNLATGEYRGYVFHEFLNQYQPASMNLKVFRTSKDTRISAHSKLFFGDFKSSEVIPYKFAAREYPNPLIGPQHVAFSRIDGNMDAVIVVTSADADSIRGIWYSIVFGRVGPFELRKNEMPTLPTGAVVMPSLNGTYGDSNYDLKIQTMVGTKPPVASENPFFPNFIRGGMIMTNGATKLLKITDGSYDFYTGRIGFVREVMGGVASTDDQAWIGEFQAGKRLSLTNTRIHFVTGPPPKPSFSFKEN